MCSCCSHAHPCCTHAQGAVFFDWTADCVDADSGAPVQLQMRPDLLFAALEAKGVAADRPVVVRRSASR